jgi:hypothetical protein
MKKKIFLSLLFSIIFIVLTLNFAFAIEVTRTPTGVLKYDKLKSAEGYTLLQNGPIVRLMSMDGMVVHEWRTGPGGDAQLTKNGTLLRSSPCWAVGECDNNPIVPDHQWGGSQGRLREWTWDGEVIWDIDLATDNWIQHHTFVPTDDGTVLVLLWERLPRADAITAGRDPATVNPEGNIGNDVRPGGTYNGDLWPDAILEVEKDCDEVLEGETCESYNIVWEWHAIDHLCNDQRQDCIDINYHIPRPTDESHRASADFMHCNSVDYLKEENLVVLNSRIFGESYLIDKASGDIVFRWGNPSVWNTSMEPASYMNDGDTQLFGPHGTHVSAYDATTRIVNLIIFDNGWLRPEGDRSRAVKIEVDLDNPDSYLYDDPIWTYQTASANSLNSPFVSYAQCVGENVVITSGGEGHIIEVTPAGAVVWEYVAPGSENGDEQCENIDGVRDSFMFRSYRYAEDYEGLVGPFFDKDQRYRYPDCRGIGKKK